MRDGQPRSRQFIEFLKLLDAAHPTHTAIKLGCDADMAQHRAGELGKEAFDEIEPRAVLWGKGEFEATDTRMPLDWPDQRAALGFV